MAQSQREADRKSYYKHQEKRCAKSRKWNKDNPERHSANQRAYYARKAEAQRQWQRDKLQSNREIVLQHYGKFCHCPGCNVIESKWLSLDHIEGGGNAHRKTIGGSGSPTYRWIIKNNFPPIFQVLCHNCNLSKGFYGRCPHEEIQHRD